MANPRIGVIGIPGKWSTETLADEVAGLTGQRLVIDMAKVELDLTTQQLRHGDLELCNLDALIVKKISAVYSPATLDRLEMLRIAEARGVRLFSPASQILRLVDRLACTVTLRNGGIPMPPTTITENPDAALATVQRYGRAVLKPLYSTKARGMCLIDGSAPRKEIIAQLQAFQQDNPVMYIQQRIELNGRDLGMVFLGGEYLGSYARVAKDDSWNTTIHSGGHYQAHQPAPAVIELARRAQGLFNLDFTTVDVVETDQGPVVFEVSAFGGFRGAKEALGINAARAYARYVMAQLQGAGQ